MYAEAFPEKIKALAPISTVVSGEISKERYSKEALDEWEKTGRQIRPRTNGGTKKLKWSHLVDRVKYDLLPKADLLTMSVLMIVGELDDSTPVNHQQILFDKLPSQDKEMHIIKGGPHTFKDQEHLDEIYQIFDKRIKKIQ
ncbi:hypothetical protein KKH82_04025 [Patescibacteria group bacterium]|nr:hypothetical protein [Patescibacteria group bacterium]